MKRRVLALVIAMVSILFVARALSAAGNPLLANGSRSMPAVTPADGAGQATPAPTQTPIEDVTATEQAATSTPSATPTAWAIVVNNTVQPAGSTPTVTVTPSGPPPTSVNGVPAASIIVLPITVTDRASEIFAKGQELGRNPRAFSKLGDSTILYPQLLGPFDKKNFKLGTFGYLQPAVDFFAGSFARDGVGAKKALHTWTVFDPMWADKSACKPNEMILPCEFRLHNPSVILIRLGVNDATAGKLFDQDLRKIVDFCIESGVIPVLGTKPDRFEGPDNTINKLIRKIAAEYAIPLWDYDLVAGTVPDRGLSSDNAHMVASDTYDYGLPRAFKSGDALHDLTALMMLESLRQQVIQPGLQAGRHDPGVP